MIPGAESASKHAFPDAIMCRLNFAFYARLLLLLLPVLLLVDLGRSTAFSLPGIGMPRPHLITKTRVESSLFAMKNTIKGNKKYGSEPVDSKEKKQAKTEPYIHNPQWLDEATQEILDLKKYPVGSLRADDVAEMTELMKAWPRRRSPAAAAKVERLLKRVVDEVAAIHPAVVKVTSEMYTAALDAWGTSNAPGSADRAMDIHAGMVRLYGRTGDRNVQPDVDSYNALLKAMRNECKTECSESILSEMKDTGIHPNESSVRIVLETYGRALRDFTVYTTWEERTFVVQRCEEILSTLESVTASSGHALQNVYAHSQLDDSVAMTEDLLANMTASYETGSVFAKPTTANYNVILLALSKSKNRIENAPKAESLLLQMERTVDNGGIDVDPDRLSYAVTILVCARCNDFDAAERVLQRMERQAERETQRRKETSSAAPPVVVLDVECYNVVLQALSRCRRHDAPDRALRIVKRMENSGTGNGTLVLPNIRSWNAVLNTFARATKKNDQTYVLEAENLLSRILDMNREEVENTTPDAYTFAGVLSAYQRLATTEASKRAERLIRQMEDLYRTGEIHSPPDVFHYTMLCGTWTRSGDELAADRVLQILVHMINRDKSGVPNTKPNVRTFNAALQCLASIGDGERAEQLLFDHMVTAYNGGDSSAKPDIFSFYWLIEAYCMSGKQDAGLMAEGVIDRMYELNEDGKSTITPDSRCFNRILSYYKKSDRPDAPYRAEYLLNRMICQYKDNRHMEQPSLSAIATVVECYSRVSHHDAGINASRLLELTRTLKNDYGASTLVVDTAFMNTVLFAWVNSGDENAANRAEHYLDEMENLALRGDKFVQPDSRSYGLVLSAWSKSRHSEKFRRSLQILRRMEKQQDEGNRKVCVDEHARALVINACAFSHGGRKVKSDAFSTAVTVFDEILKFSVKEPPSSLSFGWFIQACGRLRALDDDSLAQILRAFKICCEKGRINDFVLGRLKGALPTKMYCNVLQLPDRHQTGKIEVKATDLPLAWTRNTGNHQENQIDRSSQSLQGHLAPQKMQMKIQKSV